MHVDHIVDGLTVNCDQAITRPDPMCFGNTAVRDRFYRKHQRTSLSGITRGSGTLYGCPNLETCPQRRLRERPVTSPAPH